MSKYWLTALIILVNALSARAQEMEIVVVGLFAGNAVVQIDGNQHLLKEGKTSPEGVKLISATSQYAVLEVAGKQQKYELGTQITTNYAEPAKQPMVSLWPTNGMYQTAGTVNGYSVDFLVDTGATTVALNAATARRLGLDYYRGQQIGIRTASGLDVAYKVKLDYVQIEQIKLYNVEAVVIDGAEPARALLGMSFLGQLDIEHNGERMDLKQKY